MAQDRTCRECGLPLPADAPGGACPVCSLETALRFAPPAAPLQQRRVSEPAQHPTAENEILGNFGDYELIELIARGGMGVVYKARQTSLNRTVALKMIQGGASAGTTELKRFQAEAEAVAHLQHPNIVAIHQVSEHQGQHFFSMDFVAGRTLADVARDGPMPTRRAATYVKTTAEAIHYAHQHGIIHRDLKPANVIIDEHDQPRITDFGLAKQLADSQLTITGQVLGSPNYLPPEQAEPKRGAIGPPSDVYALGAILYHLVTGRPPFQAESLTTLLRQVVETDPVPPRALNPSIPRDLETICLKCLAKEPRHRYATGQSLADDLTRFLNHEPVLARPVGAGEQAWRWCRRQPVRAGLIAALIVVFLGGTAGVFWQWRRAQANAAAELRQRQAAEAAGNNARIREYTANLSLAQNQIQALQFGQALETLLKLTPEPQRGWEWGWLLRSCCQDLMTLSGDAALGTLAVFSPESPPRLLATAGFTDVVTIWDFGSGEVIGTLSGHRAGASLSPFSQDGKRLCTYSWYPNDGTVRVWDVEDPRKPRTLFELPPHGGAVNYGVISPEGRRLATAGADGKVRVYDVTTGTDTGLANDYGDAIISLAFSPDGHRLAYGGGTWGWTRSQDTSIRVWNLFTGETRPLAGHVQAVFGLAWSPDGRLLVSCGLDGRIKAWDPDSGAELQPFVASPKQRVVCRADFSPDGQLLGVVGMDDPNPTARATLFDVKTRRVVRELAGHSMVVQGIRFSPDGKYIATSGLERAVKIWSVAMPPAFVSLEGHGQVVWTAVFSPDSRRVATGSLDQTARIWDSGSGELLQTLVVGFPVVSLAFSHDGQKLVTVGPENSAYVWRIKERTESGKQKAEMPEGEELLRLRGHTRPVLAVAWSPDDRWIATGSKDTTARIANANTGEIRLSLIGHSNAVMAVAFSPDGSVLATGSADGTARLWSTLSGQCLHVLTNHVGGVLSIAFSPTGHWLATGGSDCTARLWDTETGRQLHCLGGHVNGVSSVAFSPDGQRLVTAPGGTDLQAGINREFRVFFWDVASGYQLFSLNPHDNTIYAATFSAEGSKLVTAGGDFTARIWTAFPWRSADYPGGTNSLAARLEQYKRQFWKNVFAAPTLPRPWTNGFRVYHHVHGDMNLPPAGSKTQPLFPIPPRSGQAGSNHIDLGAVYNVALNETWQPLVNVTNVDLSLAALPAGLHAFDAITFDVRGIIQLRCAAPDSEIYPTNRMVIPPKRPFQRIHVLHGVTGAEWHGREIASFELHYAGGAVAEIPIRYAEHVRDFRDGTTNCSNAHLAWGAENPADDRPRLYRATFLNPKPELEVLSLDYVSKVTRCGPFLIALTVD